MASSPLPINNQEGNPSSTASKTFSELFPSSQINATIDIKQPSTFRGKPAVFFSSDEVSKLSDPLKFALIGKFSHGKPPISDIRSFIDALGIKGNHTTGLIDNKHILLNFTHEEDFQRFWCREVWIIKKFPMRVFRWNKDFSPDFESPLVPVWISLPMLPLHFYNKAALFSIGKTIGTPMKLDKATTSFIRPSLARLCVEIDVSNHLVQSVWIGSEEDNDSGFWQQIIYENVPDYCLSCAKLGHDIKSCFISNPALKTDHKSQKCTGGANKKADINPSKKQKMITAPTTQYVPKKLAVASVQVNPLLLAGSDLYTINTTGPVLVPITDFSNVADQVTTGSDVADFNIDNEKQQYMEGTEDPNSTSFEFETVSPWDNFITGEKHSDIFSAIPSLADEQWLESRNAYTAMDLHAHVSKANSDLSLDELKKSLRCDSAAITSAYLHKYPNAADDFTPVTRRRNKKKKSPGRPSVVTRAAAKTLFSYPPKT